MKKKRRLIWHLFPYYVITIILSLTAVTWYASGALRQFFLAQTRNDLEARAHLVEKQISQYLAPLDQLAVDFICKAIGSSAATRITVILPTGRVIGDTEENPSRMDNHAKRPEIAQALAGSIGTAIRFSATVQQRLMYVAIPVKHNDKSAAIIRTSIPITSIDQTLHAVQLKIAIGGFLIAIIATGISFYISRRISKPIQKMKSGATRFAQGDLSHRLPSPDTEELAGLTESLNAMASQLNDRIQTIINQRNEVEVILSSMVEGVIAIDTKDNIISINAAAAKMFNSTVDYLKNRSVQEALRNPPLQKIIQQALSTNMIVEGDINLYQNEEREIHVHSSPLKDAQENPIGLLVVLQDVTQLRRLENIRREFVANVSHEIKTPLTAIKGFVETLRHNDVENIEESHRFLDITLKHVNRLNAIVEDLLSLSRIEQEGEKKAIQFKESRLRDVMQTAIQVCQSKAEAKNISVELECPENTTAKIDRQLIEQAAVNLLDNAIKYSEDESLVQVSVVSENGQLALNFKDHGIGIASNHLPRLFERFYRVDKARSRKLGGTGLGLAIVKHIAQVHGGSVTVDSTPGKGSKFTLYLPAQ